MNHPQEDNLLLLAYGELDPMAAAEVERHVASCAECHERFVRLERGRVALEWTTTVASPARRRPVRWAGLTILAAAAAVAAVMLTGGPSPHDRPRAWPEQREWSATAGYIAGGQPLITIDAQLTRLEQERSYVLP